ncbi:FAD synthase isoform X2 [Nilaparvata lugens]|nr:FAD synthase isoform X2 [Nilaparvata lugens]XP_039285670.1 FAD synthase isoform X2 [Nilaparvata lugens]XP_039285671.1 FAD synthase isoform X2 [Nilaparvata lugens]
MPDMSVGIIIIGDEILKGHVSEANSGFLCKELYSLGIKIGKISVIQDSVAEIANEIRTMKSSNYSYILTTGGVGPTHDDVTYEGVAKAFNTELMLNSQMMDYYKSYCGNVTGDMDKNPQLRIANIPVGSEIVIIPTGNEEPFKSWNGYPIVKVSNVIVLPGIPELMRLCFKEVKKLYFNDILRELHHRNLFFDCNEIIILSALNKAVDVFKESVVFGSYPVLSSKFYQTRVTLESKDEMEVMKAEEFLRSSLPEQCIVDPVLATAGEDVYDLANNTNDLQFATVLKASIKVVEEAFASHKPESLFINFNGGKDCTALLHVVAAVWMKTFNTLPKIRAVHFKSNDPFPELEEFIETTIKRYNVPVSHNRVPIREGLGDLLAENPELVAGFLGTRRSDPHGGSMQYNMMTDAGWPKLLRINPLLEWTYKNVWTFLKDLKVPYCILYDQGYTSIGNKSNTFPNPKLSFIDSDGVKKFHPAYTLDDESAERAGRA